MAKHHNVKKNIEKEHVDIIIIDNTIKSSFTEYIQYIIKNKNQDELQKIQMEFDNYIISTYKGRGYTHCWGMQNHRVKSFARTLA